MGKRCSPNLWVFLLRKPRKCHGARCNKVYVHNLQETKLWHMFCWHFKNNLRTNAKGAQTPMFEALRFGKQDKRFAVLFPNFSENVLHFDGTSMIFITVPRLFSSSAAIYVTIVWITASLSQHLAGYIQLVDQLSEIIVCVRSFEILQWILCQLQ